MHISPTRRRVRTFALAIALTGGSVLSDVLPSSSVGTAHAAPINATDGSDDDDALTPRISCPLLGPSEFINSWGAGRSGGRPHQGVDMIAERDTPIVAVRSGEVLFKRSRLGGNAVWLTTTTGDQYYYAHLDGFQGSSRSVVRGEVIGYVGSTGNAGGPHLHFETHPNGAAVNPFNAVFAACVGPAVNVTLNSARTATDSERTLVSNINGRRR